MEWLTPKEAAAMLKMCIKTIRRRIKDGELTATKLGYKTVRISKDSVDSLLNGNGTPHPHTGRPISDDSHYAKEIGLTMHQVRRLGGVRRLQELNRNAPEVWDYTVGMARKTRKSKA